MNKVVKKFKLLTHYIRKYIRSLKRNKTFKYKIRYVSMLAIFIFIVMTIIVFVGNSFGLFQSEQKMDIDIKTAFFCIEEGEYVYNLDIEELIPSDEEKEYYFTVANYNDRKVSNVDLSYNIEVVTTTNLPITYKIYTEEGSNNLLGANNLLTDIDGAWYNNYKTNNNVVFNHDERRMDTYRLAVLFPVSYKNNETYADQIESVQIIINVKQLIGDETN